MKLKGVFLFLFSLTALLIIQTLSAQTINNNLQVSATIPAREMDFPIQIEVVDEKTDSYSQNETIEYKITYGNLLYESTSIEIETRWYKGIIEGESEETVDIVNYVVGSASNAYNNTPAVVDLINNKITWDISSIPAQTTSQTITFELRTTDSFTASNLVNFSVKARTIHSDVVTSYSTVTKSYLYVVPTPTPTTTSTPTPTRTPTPSPRITSVAATSTPGPTSTPTPTPTPIPITLSFVDVSINSVSSSSTSISIQTSKSSTVKLYYGLSSIVLDKSITDLNEVKSHVLKIEELKPNTNYFFKITAISQGASISSDIFTFKTALPSKVASIDKASLVITSSNVILKGLTQLQKNFVVLAKEIPYGFHFAIDEHEAIKNIQVFVRNKYVLGFIESAQAIELNTTSGKISEIQPGVFSGSLKTPETEGVYEVYVRITDINGNIEESKLFDLKVSRKLTILDQYDQPIHKARITLYYYNKKTNKYQILTSQTFAITNPTYTNIDGTIQLSLPQGKYKAKITALRYKSKEIIFTLGENRGQDYPLIKLQNDNVNIAMFIKYYANTSFDFLNLTKQYVKDVSSSSHYLELNAFISLLIFVFLTLISFSEKIKIPFLHLYYYFNHNIILGKAKSNNLLQIKGYIKDKKNPLNLNNIDVFLMTEDNKILSHMYTNKNGYFHFVTIYKKLKFMIIKRGQAPYVISYSDAKKNKNGEYIISLKKNEEIDTNRIKTRLMLKELLSISFEGFLVVTLIFELALGYTFGWFKTMPFILLSILNIFLWLIHINHVEFKQKCFTNLSK